MICGGADVIIIEIKYTKNAMQLNHPEIILHSPVHGKTVFHETNWSLVPKRLGSAALNTQAMETAESDLAPRKLTILETQQ